MWVAAIVSLSMGTVDPATIAEGFARRWDGTVTVSGACLENGKLVTTRPKEFQGFVLIEHPGGEVLLLRTNDFPNGIRFHVAIQPVAGTFTVSAEMGQSEPLPEHYSEDFGKNVTGTVSIASGWLMMDAKVGLTGFLAEEFRTVKKTGWAIPNKEVSCSTRISYAMSNADWVRATATAPDRQAPTAKPTRKKERISKTVNPGGTANLATVLSAPAAPPQEPPPGSPSPTSRPDQGSPGSPPPQPPFRKGSNYGDVLSRFGEPERKEVFGDYMNLYYTRGAMRMYGENGGECKVQFKDGAVWNCEGCNTALLRCSFSDN